MGRSFLPIFFTLSITVARGVKTLLFRVYKKLNKLSLVYNTTTTQPDRPERR